MEHRDYFYGIVTPQGESWIGADDVIYQQYVTKDGNIVVNLPVSEVEVKDTETGMIMAD